MKTARGSAISGNTATRAVVGLTGRFVLAMLMAGASGRAETGTSREETEPTVTLDAVEVTAASRWLSVTEATGRVQFRPAEAGAPLRFVKAGAEFGPGETATTGLRARLELVGGPDGERWRLGQRTVFQARPGGGRLLAGTALLVVPGNEVRLVETFGSEVRLGDGTWILQAVENEGLKVICLDGPARLETEVVVEGGAKRRAEVRLKPGELIFVLPGERGFGPLVTIYLEELLATSRLVRGFSDPLPRMTRLVNQGIAQREYLKGLTSALVAGARDEDGFQVVLPRSRVPADNGEKRE